MASPKDKAFGISPALVASDEYRKTTRGRRKEILNLLLCW
jgi:hypothetical protein